MIAIKQKISRRQLLTALGLGVGITTIAGCALFKMNGADEAGATASDSDQPLLEPSTLPVRRLEPGLVEATLVASPAGVRVSGVSLHAMTYNGSFPGPTLQLREGDRVRLKFVNQLAKPMQNVNGNGMNHSPRASNLHTHGLHIAPSADDPFGVLEPGESRVEEFEVPERSAGTYWYHPHPHGHVAEQQFAGLYGAIVVKGKLEQEPAFQRADEHLLVLSDLTIVSGKVADESIFDLLGKEGELLLVNGQHRAKLVARTSTLRLRLVNASITRPFNLQLEQHTMHLIGTDGGYLEKPIALETLLLAPGERAEVMVQLMAKGTYRLQQLPYVRSTFSRGASEAQTLLSVVAPDTKPSPLPERMPNLERLQPSATATKRVIDFDMGFSQGFTINNKTFDMNRTDISTTLGALEVWEIVNSSPLDHPFHLHTYPFQVLERSSGGVWKPEPYLAWKDTVNLHGDERIRIAVRFDDFKGRTVYHCHVSGHEDKGMMGVLEVS